MQMLIPVTIESKQFEVTGPIKSDLYPINIYENVTNCTIVLTDGVKTYSLIGRYIDRDENNYVQSYAEARASEAALNSAEQYGLVVTA